MPLQWKFLSPPPKPKWGAEEQFRTIFARYPHASWVLDRATLRVLAVNEAAALQFGYSAKALLGVSYLDLLTPEDAVSMQRTLNQRTNSRGPAHWRMRTNNGEVIHVEVSWRPVPFNRVPALLLVIESTRQSMRRLERETDEGRERLEALSKRLVEIQEAERAEIARELHDEIGQLLTGLKLMMTLPGTLADAGNGNGTRAAGTPEMIKIVSELIGRVRDLSMDLRPPMLDEIGVVAALQWHFERYTRRTGIKVSFDHPASNPRFPASLEIAAFRIIQEALTNTARHAGVDHVLVELRADPEYLRLRIEDLGHGFNPDLEPAGRSAGLTGMKERALLIGGQVTIESARDAGTRIFVVLPLRGTGSTWN